MPATILTAGDASNPIGMTRGDDGTVVVQTGLAGAKVNALTMAADGTPTFLKQAASSMITSGTAQATTSGTSIDFTGIPSWVKRITVMLRGVSVSGTSIPIIQIGAGSIDATGYAGSSWQANTVNTQLSTGFMTVAASIAAYVRSGHMVLTHMGSNIWVASGITGREDAADIGVTGGAKTLGGTLDRIRLTTVNGTDTFDAGSVNILYE